LTHPLRFTVTSSYEENELPVITPSTAVAIVITIFRIVLQVELGILLIICSSIRCNKSTSKGEKVKSRRLLFFTCGSISSSISD